MNVAVDEVLSFSFPTYLLAYYSYKLHGIGSVRGYRLTLSRELSFNVSKMAVVQLP